MPAENEPSTQAAEADLLDQRRDVLSEAADPEQSATAADPDGVEADPADVLDQAIEVPDDDGHDGIEE